MHPINLNPFHKGNIIKNSNTNFSRMCFHICYDGKDVDQLHHKTIKSCKLFFLLLIFVEFYGVIYIHLHMSFINLNKALKFTANRYKKRETRSQMFYELPQNAVDLSIVACQTAWSNNK